jgi:hypothetical protein
MNIGWPGSFLRDFRPFCLYVIIQEGFSFWIIRSCPVSYALFVEQILDQSYSASFAGEGIILLQMVLKAPLYDDPVLRHDVCSDARIGLAVGVGRSTPVSDGKRLTYVGWFERTLYMILSMLFIGVVVSLEYWALYRILTGQYHQQPFSLFAMGGEFCPPFAE